MFQPNTPQWVTIVVTFALATLQGSDDVGPPAFLVITGALIVWWLEGRRQKRHKLEQSDLGVSYAEGRGVSQDDAQAEAWTRKAADQGDADAQYNLGVMYRDGQGVPKDAVLAYMWFNLSVARGAGEQQKTAASNRDAIAKTMTPQQIADALKLAREWLSAFKTRGGK